MFDPPERNKRDSRAPTEFAIPRRRHAAACNRRSFLPPIERS